MYDEHDQLDHELARLADSLRSSRNLLACLQLAEFAFKLEHCIHSEESAFSAASGRLARPGPLAKVKTEHASLRRLISAIAIAIDQSDERRGLELVSKLRSVLLLHLAKEERLRDVQSIA
ncbi:MAG TPA: hemerythrin domain-containing protein [Kofleriaceae bacterium]|jgi:hypothetical protein|nr:hemerythrin domain-containing protein [Kofleriaceae bacterium]